MDVRGAIRNFVEQGRELYQRLHSSEGDVVSPVDLHILEVQIYLLDKEVARRKAIQHNPTEKHHPTEKQDPGHDFPPFNFGDDQSIDK